MTPFIAEIIGTMLLILLGNGVVANVVLKGTKGNNSGWIVITAGWAFAVFVGVTVAGPISGAHLNPAVTIGLAIAGKFAWNQVVSYIMAQLIGAMSGAFLVWLFHKDHFAITEDEGGKLACFSTGPAIRNTFSNMIGEIIGAFVLVFVIFYLAGPELSMSSATDVKIGLGSVIIGNITASSAVIAGAIKGDIDVQGPVVVDTSAVVMGNIKSRSVQINNGAVIEGFCSQCYADIDVESLFGENK